MIQKACLINHCTKIHDVDLVVYKQIGIIYSIELSNNMIIIDIIPLV